MKDKFENKKISKKIKTNSWLNGEIEKNNQFRKMIKKNKDQIRQNEIEWCN